MFLSFFPSTLSLDMHTHTGGHLYILLCSAQAFYGPFESFVTWLRSTERKIQRDDPIKLEEEDLKAGLKHLKVCVYGGKGATCLRKSP